MSILVDITLAGIETLPRASHALCLADTYLAT